MSRSSVLLLHSGGFTSRQWRKLAEQLAPTHHVLAPDLIGYGPNGWPLGEPFDFHQDVEMVAGLLTEPAHVVGHSYGGLLALHLALEHGDLVRSIAVYEPVAFGILDEPADEAVRAELVVFEQQPYQPDAQGLDERWLARFVDWWNGPGAWEALPDGTRASMRSVGWKLSEEVRSLAQDRTDRAGYAAITAPTLILGGDQSPRAARRTAEKLAAALPHARHTVFTGLGHMGPITHAALVNAAIAEHVAGDAA